MYCYCYYCYHLLPPVRVLQPSALVEALRDVALRDPGGRRAAPGVGELAVREAVQHEALLVRGRPGRASQQQRRDRPRARPAPAASHLRERVGGGRCARARRRRPIARPCWTPASRPGSLWRAGGPSPAHLSRRRRNGCDPRGKASEASLARGAPRESGSDARAKLPMSQNGYGTPLPLTCSVPVEAGMKQAALCCWHRLLLNLATPKPWFETSPAQRLEGGRSSFSRKTRSAEAPRLGQAFCAASTTSWPRGNAVPPPRADGQESVKKEVSGRRCEASTASPCKPHAPLFDNLLRPHSFPRMRAAWYFLAAPDDF